MSIPVSVIIPTFNRANLIPETLESIMEQSYQPSEIIVVDDGSTDNTEQVIAQYVNKVRYIKIKNSGVCTARNVGVEEAKCEWIAFCDSDDLWHPDKLMLQVELIQKVPEIEYCFTNFKIVKNGRWLKNEKFDDAPLGYWDVPRRIITPDSFVITEPFYHRVLLFQPIFQSNIIMTKSFFHRVGGYDERFGRRISEDFEFTLRCVQESPIGVVTNPVVGIRWHESNLSSGRIPGISFIIGDIEILKFSLEHHRLGTKYKSLIQEQIIRRSEVVVHGAFAYQRFEIVRDMLKNVPPGRRSLKLWTKAAVAYLPIPIAKGIQRVLVGLRSTIRHA